MAVSANEVQKYLKGVDYPARKDDLVMTAKDNGAPDEVVSAIQSMPDEEYIGPQDVSKSMGGR